jgi:molybdopterin converting factor subunit 1
MLVRVRLFAVARERAGRPVVEVELADEATVGDLTRALAERVPDLAAIMPSARFAVDSEYADDSTPIAPGAELALIPPVSGGSSEADLPSSPGSGSGPPPGAERTRACKGRAASCG